MLGLAHSATQDFESRSYLLHLAQETLSVWAGMALVYQFCCRNTTL